MSQRGVIEDEDGNIVECIMYKENNLYHRVDGPALIELHENEIIGEHYYLYGLRHREDGPAIIYYGDKAKDIKMCEEYYLKDKRYRNNNMPSYIEYYDDGSIFYEAFYNDKTLLGEIYYRASNRDSNRASDRDQRNANIKSLEMYYHSDIEGDLHRDDNMPAYIKYYDNGNILLKMYCYRGYECNLYGGPAVIEYYDNGNVQSEAYYKEERTLHRIDGPAYIEYNRDGNAIRADSYIEGFKKDVQYTEEELNTFKPYREILYKPVL